MSYCYILESLYIFPYILSHYLDILSNISANEENAESGGQFFQYTDEITQLIQTALLYWV